MCQFFSIQQSYTKGEIKKNPKQTNKTTIKQTNSNVQCWLSQKCWQVKCKLVINCAQGLYVKKNEKKKKTRKSRGIWTCYFPGLEKSC